MPTFYRIEKRIYAAQAFAGVGGLFAPGRWHRKRIHAAYAAEHQAVGMLEKLVWLGTLADARAGDFVVVPIDLPDDLIEGVDRDALPEGWDGFPHLVETREIGTRWLRASEAVALRVPSAAVPRASNVLINPLHPDLPALATGAPEPFDWDPRLFKPEAPPDGRG